MLGAIDSGGSSHATTPTLTPQASKIVTLIDTIARL
jgi:hypothetical protein